MKRVILLLHFLLGVCTIGCDSGGDSDGGNPSDGEGGEQCGISYGIWLDPATDLCWSWESGSVDWQGAMDYCENLDEGGFTDWRAPNIDELRSIVDGCDEIESGGACPIHDGDGSSSLTSACFENDCGVNNGPGGSIGCFSKEEIGLCGGHWSSSSDASDSTKAFLIHFNYGELAPNSKDFDSSFTVNCVR